MRHVCKEGNDNLNVELGLFKFCKIIHKNWLNWTILIQNIVGTNIRDFYDKEEYKTALTIMSKIKRMSCY